MADFILDGFAKQGGFERLITSVVEMVRHPSVIRIMMIRIWQLQDPKLLNASGLFQALPISADIFHDLGVIHAVIYRYCLKSISHSALDTQISGMAKR